MLIIDAIKHVEGLIADFEKDLRNGTDYSTISFDEYESLKIAKQCMKSVHFAKQAMSLASDGKV